jgi:hypothetical protein
MEVIKYRQNDGKIKGGPPSVAKLLTLFIFVYGSGGAVAVPFGKSSAFSILFPRLGYLNTSFHER